MTGSTVHRRMAFSSAGFIACLAILWTTGCAQPKKPATQTTEPAKRGEYLVSTTGCDDCHTPKTMGADGLPSPDMSRRLAGHAAGAPYPTWQPSDLSDRTALVLSDPNLTAWAGPWGVSFSANLTPDEETGLGGWTEDAFVQAMRTGKHQGQPNGRPILPPMPWQSLANMTDDDLKAIWAYLQTITPVNNAVPTPVPPAAPPGGAPPQS